MQNMQSIECASYLNKEVGDMSQMAATRRTMVEVRAELDVTQTKLAAVSKVNQSAISRIEAGETVSEWIAQKVLIGINHLRVEQELPPLDFNDISWKLR